MLWIYESLKYFQWRPGISLKMLLCTQEWLLLTETLITQPPVSWKHCLVASSLVTPYIKTSPSWCVTRAALPFLCLMNNGNGVFFTNAYCSVNGRMMCDLNKYLSILVSVNFSLCCKMHFRICKAIQKGKSGELELSQIMYCSLLSLFFNLKAK